MVKQTSPPKPHAGGRVPERPPARHARLAPGAREGRIAGAAGRTSRSHRHAGSQWPCRFLQRRPRVERRLSRRDTESDGCRVDCTCLLSHSPLHHPQVWPTPPPDALLAGATADTSRALPRYQLQSARAASPARVDRRFAEARRGSRALVLRRSKVSLLVLRRSINAGQGWVATAHPGAAQGHAAPCAVTATRGEMARERERASRVRSACSARDRAAITVNPWPSPSGLPREPLLHRRPIGPIISM